MIQKRLGAVLEGRLPEALEFLREMVEVNSYTGNRAGVLEVARRTARWFEPLGFAAEFVPHRDAALGDHLILTRRGRGGRGGRAVGMVSHLDTVFPPEEEERNQFRWSPQGDRIYGPGTIDIKGGTALMWLVLHALAEGDPAMFEDTSWVLLWNSSEETLSEHFAEVACERLDGERALAALVFESEGRPEGIPSMVVARKGRATFRVTVEGRAAHAGAKHARGANAIRQLARVVDRIEALTDSRRHLTFNVGRVEGGVAVNRVPHEAWADVEMRAFDPAVYRDGMRSILALAGQGDVRAEVDGHACRVRVEVLSESPPWPRNEGTDGLMAVWKAAADELGRPLGAEERGGLSDGNWLWKAVPTLDGLGPHGDNDHCSERSADGSKVPEYLLVSSLVPKGLLNAVALRRLVAGT